MPEVQENFFRLYGTCILFLAYPGLTPGATLCRCYAAGIVAHPTSHAQDDVLFPHTRKRVRFRGLTALFSNSRALLKNMHEQS